VAQGVFDERLIILHHSGGDRIQLPQVAAFTAAFRKLLIAACDEPAVPARVRSLISGHNADGTALDQPHVAFLALAHVGSLHADGHIMGFVMALPRGIQPESEHELCKVLGRCLEASGRDSLRLLAGRAGACELRIEDRVKPPRTLQEATWVAESRSWASVTPVVLDKLAPRRHVNDDSWAANQIVHSCVRQGLPKPVGVAILPVSRFTGAPPARAFPALMRKSDNVKRWHVHAQLYFEEPVRGPLVLGAGRYRGMGLCRPLDAGRRGSDMKLIAAEFPDFFQSIHGYSPFPWQRELAKSVASGSWPAVLDLPTASGKTAIMDVAVFALAVQAVRPTAERTACRRIAIVVDRRIVVDDAFRRAQKIRRALLDARDGVLHDVAEALRSLGGETPLEVALLRDTLLNCGSSGFPAVTSRVRVVRQHVAHPRRASGQRLLNRS